MDFHRTFQGGKDMNLKLENSLVVLSQRKKEQGLPQRPTKKERNQELTQEERLLQHYQEQISQMHESNFQQELQAKLDSGQELTPEEEQYLEKVNPDALKEHEKLKEEVAAYRKQLQNCRTKKDVEKLKLYKMGQFMSEVKTVSNDPHIPKAKKKAMLEQILKRTYAIEKEHNDYTKTPEYQTKPDKEPYEDVSPADKDKVLPIQPMQRHPILPIMQKSLPVQILPKSLWVQRMMAQISTLPIWSKQSMTISLVKNLSLLSLYDAKLISIFPGSAKKQLILMPACKADGDFFLFYCLQISGKQIE